jgi:hypothetical protein
MMSFTLAKLIVGVIATIGLYTVLYKENKFYRFWEHVFLGLAAGWACVALWTETLKPNWWDKMTGRIPEGVLGAADFKPGVEGFWLWAILLPIGAMGYMIFSKKHAWMARIPVGVILGLWSGQQIQVWWERFGPQIKASIVPIVPTSWSSFSKPYVAPGTDPATLEQIATVNGTVYPSQAIGNIIATITVLSVLSYFLFSIDVKSKVLQLSTKTGRYLLMVGFGAIFGSTVMMRFSLLIDRMYFIFIETLRDGIFRGFGGG